MALGISNSAQVRQNYSKKILMKNANSTKKKMYLRVAQAA